MHSSVWPGKKVNELPTQETATAKSMRRIIIIWFCRANYVKTCPLIQNHASMVMKRDI